jgi:hypothetical protein
MVVSDDTVPDIVTVEADAYEKIEACDRARALRKACQIIDDAILRMEPDDQLLLKMRFWHGQRVPDIAKTLHLDQKKLYKRFERLCLELRRELEKAGVDKADVALLLAGGDEEVHLNFFHPGEIPPPCPSNNRGGDKARGREGRAR